MFFARVVSGRRATWVAAAAAGATVILLAHHVLAPRFCSGHIAHRYISTDGTFAGMEIEAPRGGHACYVLVDVKSEVAGSFSARMKRASFAIAYGTPLAESGQLRATRVFLGGRAASASTADPARGLPVGVIALIGVLLAGTTAWRTKIGARLRGPLRMVLPAAVPAAEAAARSAWRRLRVAVSQVGERLEEASPAPGRAVAPLQDKACAVWESPPAPQAIGTGYPRSGRERSGLPATPAPPRTAHPRSHFAAPGAIVAALDAFVKGQAEAKRVLAQAVWDQHFRLAALRSGSVAEESLPPRHNVFLIGPTGSGKTLLVSTIAELLGIPFAVCSIADLVPAGIRGLHVEDLVAGLVASAGDRADIAEGGIIFLDEIDKIADRGETLGALSSTLLRLVEGCDVEVVRRNRRLTVRTDHVLFVAAGAFEGLRSHRSAAIGFGSGDATADEGCAPPTLEQLEEYGLPRELIGRFSSLAVLAALEHKDMVAILAESRCSPLKQAQAAWALAGVELRVPPPAINAIARASLDEGLGARGIGRVLGRLLADYHPADLKADGMGALIVDGKLTCRLVKTVVTRRLPGLQAVRAQFQQPEPRVAVEPRDSPVKAFPVPDRPPRDRPDGSGVARAEDLQPWLPGPSHPSFSLPGAVPLVETAEGYMEAFPTPLVIPEETRDRHVLCIGKTGSGKTTRILLPLLASDLRDPNRSLVVFDAKGDLTHRVVVLARALRGAKTRVVYLNFADPEHTFAWNPLAGVRTRRDAIRTAHALTANMRIGRSETTFWKHGVQKVLEALILTLHEASRSNDGPLSTAEANPATLGAILDSGARQAAALLSHYGHARQTSEFLGNVNGTNAQTLMAEAVSELGVLLDERVQRSTARNELDFALLQDKPTVLVLRVPEHEVSVFAPIVSCLLASLFSFFDESADAAGGRLRRPVSLFLDEFASAMPPITNFQRRASTFRSKRISLCAAVQSIAQVFDQYGHDQAKAILASFGTVFLLPPLAQEDAEWASRESGIMLSEEIMSVSGGVADTSHRMSRPVFYPHEIAAPVRHHTMGPLTTVLNPDTPPFQMYSTPIHACPPRGLRPSDLPEARPPGFNFPPKRLDPLPVPDLSFLEIACPESKAPRKK